MKLILILAGLGSVALLGCGAFYTVENARMEARARAGDVDAQYEVAKKSLDGSNPALDSLQSLRWIRQAAERGNPKAQTALGMIYAKGVHVSQDQEKSRRWLKLAADQGFAPAQALLQPHARGGTRSKQVAVQSSWRAAHPGLGRTRNDLREVLPKRAIYTAIRTRSGRIYHDARIEAIEGDSVSIVFAPGQDGFGMARVRIQELPEALQRSCGIDGKPRSKEPALFGSVNAITPGP